MTNEKIRYILSGISATGIQAEAIHEAIDLLKEYEIKSIEYRKFLESVEAIADKMCENHCKYPDLMLAQYEDPDDAEEHLEYDHCMNCPFLQLPV